MPHTVFATARPTQGLQNGRCGFAASPRSPSCPWLHQPHQEAADLAPLELPLSAATSGSKGSQHRRASSVHPKRPGTGDVITGGGGSTAASTTGMTDNNRSYAVLAGTLTVLSTLCDDNYRISASPSPPKASTRESISDSTPWGCSWGA